MNMSIEIDQAISEEKKFEETERLKNKRCNCKNVEMGSYSSTVNIQVPFGDKPTMSIDAHILAEVVNLWNHGIWTSESCCGHGKTSGYIAVKPLYNHAMKVLGYIEIEGHQNCFYARGNWWFKEIDDTIVVASVWVIKNADTKELLHMVRTKNEVDKWLGHQFQFRKAKWNDFIILEMEI